MKKIAALVLLFLFFSFGFAGSSSFASHDYFHRLIELQRKIQEYQAKIKDLQGQERSLKNQIAYMDYQIELTLAEIEALETEITILGGDIENLEKRLANLAEALEFQEEVLEGRVRESYKTRQLTSLDVLLNFASLEDLFKRLKYLQVLAEEDRSLFEQLKQVKSGFLDQKKILEEKKEEVEEKKRQAEEKKRSLESQKAAKENLLSATQNNEANYQKLLRQVESEYAIVQRVLASQGTRVGPVSAREGIGLQGFTGCASGSHLHFTLIVNGRTVDPAPYLNNGTLARPEDLSAPYFPTLAQYNALGWKYWYDHGITQPYGANFTAYGPHNGIDMQANLWPKRGDGAPVFAAGAGVAYAGVDSCGGKYIWIDHGQAPGNLPGYKTLYVHLK